MDQPEDAVARLARAKELLQTVKHAALATVNADGSPHNSPVFMAFDEQLRGFWASDPLAQHSQNIARTHQVFMVLFDAVGKGGGLYIRATARQLDETELPQALKVFNQARKRHLQEEIPAVMFAADAPQRLFVAEPLQLWTNLAERNDAGFIIRDQRYEITPQDLQPKV